MTALSDIPEFLRRIPIEPVPAIPAEIQAMIDAGALFVLNHSGGKDSQAMTAYLRRFVPAEQIVVVHAHLPEVEWDGVIEHIYHTIGDLPLHVVQARKTFFEMVEHRQAWPSAQYRQCTSDLKRGPIDKLVRQIARERGITLIVNCMGIRAEESAARAKQHPLKINNRLSKAGRQVIDWLPIFDWLVVRVRQTVAQAGQRLHWAYDAGMTRLSCCFCILASRADLQTAATLRPGLYHRIVETEQRIGHTIRHGVTLEETTGIAASLPCAA